ncbi:hypothetical protein EUZ85_30355 [Hahella sp. KA22]|nr:hypothetical protein ENC22_27770 [Hahella sp. KA22]QAY58159.1 hypothetical protein EUZ85_30355 [Hahella sp. KA22]
MVGKTCFFDTISKKSRYLVSRFLHLSHHRLMPSPLIVLLADCSITQLSNQSINKQWWAMVSKF